MKKLICILSTLVIFFPHTFAQSGFEELAKTPPMGWNSWNTFRKEIHEELVREVADAFVEKGLKDAGYEFIVIDDGWQIERDQEGNIIPDPDKFPSGIEALARLCPFHGTEVRHLLGCGDPDLRKAPRQPGV